MPKIKRNGRIRSVPRKMGETGKKRRGEEKDEVREVWKVAEKLRRRRGGLRWKEGRGPREGG